MQREVIVLIYAQLVPSIPSPKGQEQNTAGGFFPRRYHTREIDVKPDRMFERQVLHSGWEGIIIIIIIIMKNFCIALFPVKLTSSTHLIPNVQQISKNGSYCPT